MASIDEDVSRDLEAFFTDPANAATALRVARDIYGSSCDLHHELWNEIEQNEKTREGINAFNVVMDQVRKKHELEDSLSANSDMMRKARPEKASEAPVFNRSLEKLVGDAEMSNDEETIKEDNKKKQDIAAPIMEHAGTSQYSFNKNHSYNTRGVRVNYKSMEVDIESP